MSALPPPPSTGFPSSTPSAKGGLPAWAWWLIIGFIVAAGLVIVVVYFTVTRFVQPLLSEFVEESHPYPGVAVTGEGHVWMPVSSSLGYQLVKVDLDSQENLDSISIRGRSLVHPQLRGTDLYFMGVDWIRELSTIYVRPEGSTEQRELFTNRKDFLAFFRVSPSGERFAIVRCRWDFNGCKVVVTDREGNIILDGPDVAYYDELVWLGDDRLLVSVTPLNEDDYHLVLNMDGSLGRRVSANVKLVSYTLYFCPHPQNANRFFSLGYAVANNDLIVQEVEFGNDGLRVIRSAPVPESWFRSGVFGFAMLPDLNQGIFFVTENSSSGFRASRVLRGNFETNTVESLFSVASVANDSSRSLASD